MEIQDKYDALSDKLADKLGVANEEKEVDPKPRMDEYLDHSKQFLRTMVRMLSSSGPQGGNVVLTVPQNFKLQTLFDKWFDQGNSDGAFLLKDDNDTQKLLSHWIVQYEGKRESLFYFFADDALSSYPAMVLVLESDSFRSF